MTNKEAIELLKRATMFEPTLENRDYPEALDLAIKALEERPQGEWMVTAEDNDGIHRIECPFCRYEKGSDFIDYITVTFEKFPPFCENCGADMRGKNDG